MKDLGWLWHGLGGFGITAVVSVGVFFAHWPAWVPFLMVPMLGVGGYVRERLQHIGDPDPMTPHRWIEALAWPLGGIIGACVSLGWTL